MSHKDKWGYLCTDPPVGMLATLSEAKSCVYQHHKNRGSIAIENEIIIRMWEEGSKKRKIAAEASLTMAALGSRILVMQKKGILKKRYK